MHLASLRFARCRFEGLKGEVEKFIEERGGKKKRGEQMEGMGENEKELQRDYEKLLRLINNGVERRKK